MEIVYYLFIFALYSYYLIATFKPVRYKLAFSILLIGLILNGLCFYFDLVYLGIIIHTLIFVLYLLFIDKRRGEKYVFLLFFSLNSIVLFLLPHLLLISNNLALIIVFTLKHVFNNRASFSFVLLYYLVMIIYTGVFIHVDQPIYFLIVSYLIYLLAENNQRYMRKTYEDKMNEYQTKLLRQQVDEVENIYRTMRGWRHDYHNHMQKLKAHLALKQYDQMGQYLNELEADLDQIDTLVQSNNTNLDAILNSKLSIALTKDININIKAQVPNQLTVTDIDLCVIIGNLIDNAIEACEDMDDELTKFIRVYIGIFKKQLYISVTNSTKELVRKLDEDYITHKRGNHGHGLKRIDNAVNKYGGYINRKNEPGVFVTEIMLPL